MPKKREDTPLETADPSSPLSLLISNIRKRFGEDACINLIGESLPSVEWYASGSLLLDKALGGGYARGRMVEIWGPESTGKTTLILHAIAEAQKVGRACAFIDVEHALDLDYAKTLGVDPGSLLLSQPSSAEDALDILEEIARSGAVSLVGLDSTNALTPKAEIEGEMGDQLPGLQARLLSKACRKLVAPCYISACTVLWASQVRSKVGVFYGSPDVVGVGNAMKFYASQRLKIKRAETVKSGEESIAHKVRVEVVKNKVAPPYRTAELTLVFGRGIDKGADLLELALKKEVVTRAGAWYSMGEERIGQGESVTVQRLRDEPSLYGKILAAITQEEVIHV